MKISLLVLFLSVGFAGCATTRGGPAIGTVEIDHSHESAKAAANDFRGCVRVAHHRFLDSAGSSAYEIADAAIASCSREYSHMVLAIIRDFEHVGGGRVDDAYIADQAESTCEHISKDMRGEIIAKVVQRRSTSSRR